MARQRYKVLRKIDAGGMAEIYLARALSVGGIEKQVAIKRVLPSLTRNKRFVNMFLDEARLSMVLTHANIVQVFDVGRADGTYFIVMEFVDGYNLRRVFQRMAERGTRIPVHYAAFIIMELCKGLAHAHEQRNESGDLLGIVHRDVSPPNILISKAGEVKVTDFGLAKAATQLEVTDPGIVKGKFSYLSPEAADGKAVDHRADLFAAGTLLWEVLSGRRLFLGKSDLETVELVRKAEIPPLSTFNQEVTPEFESIVMKALARDPRNRWHSARDLGDELARYLFANNLKVTSYDIASMVEELFDLRGDEESATEERISMLIDEEVLNLSMLGVIGQGMRADGAKPLNDASVAPEESRQARLNVADIWQPKATVEIPADSRDSTALNEYISERSPMDRATLQHHSVVSSSVLPADRVETSSRGTSASQSNIDGSNRRSRWWLSALLVTGLAGALGAAYAAGWLDALL